MSGSTMSGSTLCHTLKIVGVVIVGLSIVTFFVIIGLMALCGGDCTGNNLFFYIALGCGLFGLIGSKLLHDLYTYDCCQDLEEDEMNLIGPTQM